jgi:hypothetical protein
MCLKCKVESRRVPAQPGLALAQPELALAQPGLAQAQNPKVLALKKLKVT